MKAEIIAVGSEMLTPLRQDTNSLYITKKLNEIGVIVGFKTIVGDRLPDLTSDVVNVAKQHYLVLAASNVVVTRYFALAILNRLEKPWLIFRFTRALALQRDATIVASTVAVAVMARWLKVMSTRLAW